MNDEQQTSLTSGDDSATCEHQEFVINAVVARDGRFSEPFQIQLTVTCKECGMGGVFLTPPLVNVNLSELIIPFSIASAQQMAEVKAINQAAHSARIANADCYVLPAPLTIGQMKGN